MHTPDGAPSPLSERVASEVRAEMARRGISQSNLAEQLGENQAWLSRRLARSGPNQITMSVDDVDRIASVLEMSARSLIERATAVVPA